MNPYNNSGAFIILQNVGGLMQYLHGRLRCTESKNHYENQQTKKRVQVPFNTNYTEEICVVNFQWSLGDVALCHPECFS